ncbi:MAG: competence/damage-inducible protein A [Actinobacteria bacterium]|nr:competence/damage-inducible protein A [Actinomycetota bacterium]
MKAEVICVGSELLAGAVDDTNGGHIARQLAKVGIETTLQVTVGDEIDCIARALGDACGRADVVIVSGGLGPTQDDLTRESLARATGRKLEFSAELDAKIRAFFKAKGKLMSPVNRVQAYLPHGSRAIANPIGTAPGIELEHQGARVFALPGVPGEMEAMLARKVIPAISGERGLVDVSDKTLRFTGIGESDLAQRIQDVVDGCRASGGPVISILASGGQIAVNLRASSPPGAAAAEEVGPVEREIRRRLGADLFGVDDQTLESVVVELAARMGLTVSVAESFTGGLLSSQLVSVPGSSKVFHTGFVTYSRAAKVKQLGLSSDLLERYGAVSEEAAAAMASGARQVSGASVGLSTTGEAGPDPNESPVGTMFIGLSWDGGSVVRKLMVSGGRAEIRAAGSTAALDALRRWLLGDGARA